MARKAFYLGCSRVGFYEIGRDPNYFEKFKGFAFKDFVCDVHPKHVEQVMGLVLRPGDIFKLKINTQKVVPLTQKEREEVKAWKTSGSRKNQQ